MASNCYSGLLTQKAVIVGNCLQQSVLRLVHAPRLASFDDWFTGFLTLVLALVCALCVLSCLFILESAKRATPRRFT
jgi:hypothetical protein